MNLIYFLLFFSCFIFRRGEQADTERGASEVGQVEEEETERFFISSSRPPECKGRGSRSGAECRSMACRPVRRQQFLSLPRPSQGQSLQQIEVIVNV